MRERKEERKLKLREVERQRMRERVRVGMRVVEMSCLTSLQGGTKRVSFVFERECE